MQVSPYGFGLFVAFVFLALTAAAPENAQGQQAHLKRFMQICEQIVTEVSPGKPPTAVCECTARRELTTIASHPQMVSAILQGVQAHHGFSLNVISSLPREQQQEAVLAVLSLGSAYAACVKQPN